MLTASKPPLQKQIFDTAKGGRNFVFSAKGLCAGQIDIAARHQFATGDFEKVFGMTVGHASGADDCQTNRQEFF